MDRLEEKLCEFYKQNAACYTSNGTTAMYLLFKALKMQNKKVLYPAITCTNPVNAAIYAGYDVEICDVNLHDYTIDMDCLEKWFKTNSIGIAVPTHIYGHIYDRENLRFLCDKYGVFLLEDAAQTVDTGLSDASVVSFGHTKIFEMKNGGGAILSKDISLIEAMSKVRESLDIVKPSPERFDNYRHDYYAIVNNNKYSIDTKYQKLHELQINSKDNFIYQIDNDITDEIEDRLEKKDSIISHRLKKAILYKTLLSKDKIVFPNISHDNNPAWRFTFLVKGNRDSLLERAREQNIDISSWYLPLNKIYTKYLCQNAEYISNHVVNLWIDESHSEEKIKEDIKILNDILINI